MASLLDIRNLSVAFPVDGAWVPVLREVNLSVEDGEFVGLVGESGSGKSMTALAILRLVPSPGAIRSGQILLSGTDILQLGEDRLQQVRGGRVGIVFQEPGTALNPVFTVGYQIEETVRIHRKMSRRAARDEAYRLLSLVAIPDARSRLRSYPHQLSGGQRQRAMLAMALAAQPDLLIADEPTTALDVTVQAQILELLASLRQELGLSVLLITHDLAVVAETCDRVAVMYAGEVVETADATAFFRQPAHPYSKGLMSVIPRLGSGGGADRLPTIPGRVPNPARLPSGCAFHPRCAEVMDGCSKQAPPVLPVGGSQTARCFLFDEDGGRAP